jgi:hypothetical protein
MRARLRQRPIILWEPRPSSCTPANLQAFLRAVKTVDVFSPNHIEFSQIYGKSHREELNREWIETRTLQFIEAGIGPSMHGSMVVRAGEGGSMIVSTTQAPQDRTILRTISR